MRDIEALIRDWQVAIDSDGNPPKVTEEERQALAREYLKAQEEREKIPGLSYLGLSYDFDSYARAQRLQRRMSTVGNFIRDSLMGSGWVPDSAALAYINQVAAMDRGENPSAPTRVC